MDKTLQNKLASFLIRIYFSLALLLTVSEVFEWREIVVFFKPMLIPTLMLHYFFASERKNKLYLLSLFFALISNVMFLFSGENYLVAGILSLMVYRLFNIILVIRLTTLPPLLPIAIATVPFVFIFSCLLNLTISYDSSSFYPAVVNGILISVLAGFALSLYVLNDNKANSWLAISTLLFVVLVFLFMIQKYYLYNIAFQPISALIFTFAHYTFLRFMLETEKDQTMIDLP